MPKKVFREVASGAKTDLPQLRRLPPEIGPGDVVMVTRLARSTRGLLDLANSVVPRPLRGGELALDGRPSGPFGGNDAVGVDWAR